MHVHISTGALFVMAASVTGLVTVAICAYVSRKNRKEELEIEKIKASNPVHVVNSASAYTRPNTHHMDDGSLGIARGNQRGSSGVTHTTVVVPQTGGYMYPSYPNTGFVEGMLMGELMTGGGNTYVDNSTTVVDDERYTPDPTPDFGAGVGFDSSPDYSSGGSDISLGDSSSGGIDFDL